MVDSYGQEPNGGDGTILTDGDSPYGFDEGCSTILTDGDNACGLTESYVDYSDRNGRAE